MLLLISQHNFGGTKWALLTMQLPSRVGGREIKFIH